jgi:LAO/AO transport system kinase
MVETVGVGQNETAVAQAVDTVVVVLTPESGDGVQVLKAGLLEVADIIVVNKSDRAGTGNFLASLRGALTTGDGSPVPVVTTDCISGTGVETVVGLLERARASQEIPCRT